MLSHNNYDLPVPTSINQYPVPTSLVSEIYVVKKMICIIINVARHYYVEFVNA